eukprot:COSAG02_NODE_12506_length_1535_cov_3.816156_1_plen_397_part_10
MTPRALFVFLSACTALMVMAHAECVCCSGNFCTAEDVGPGSTQQECLTKYPSQCAACGGGPGSCSATASAGFSSSFDFDTISIDSFSRTFVNLSSMIMLGIGLVVGTMGYKLWKYTIFILGFIIVGLPAFACIFTYGVADMDSSDLATFDQSGELPASLYLQAAAGGVLFGVVGGFCFIGIYMCVIFCMGCGVGMSTFWYIAAIILASAAYHDPDSIANAGRALQAPPPAPGAALPYCGLNDVGCHGKSPSCACHYPFECDPTAGTCSAMTVAAAGEDPEGTFETLLAIDVVCGILVGLLFLKFQKWAIMLGTSILGSGLVWTAIIQGIAKHPTGSSWQAVLVYLTDTVFFVVQLHITSKGIEIDPATGKVTVVVVQQTVPPGMGVALMAEQQIQYQ